MKFNVNDEILVRLKPHGVDEMKRQHDELKSVVPSVGEFKEPKADAEGYTSFQGWHLMSTFGHMLFAGCEPPFELDVIISEKSK